MEITAKEIMGLDFFVLLKVDGQVEEDKAEKIKFTLQKWCNDAIDGAYGGHMHFIHSLGYSQDNSCAYAFIDMGSMDPEKGINSLAEICDGLNSEFGSIVINGIELNGSEEILEQLG